MQSMSDALSDQRLFVRIVEAGSLKRAAAEVNADAATVTRKLSALEAHLGVKLLERSRQGATPTEAGVKYYEALRRLLPEFEALEADVARATDSPRGLVRLSCPVDFGARHVVGWITSLQQQYPKLEVELLLSDEYVDLTAHGIDIAIRIGALTDSALIAKKLGEMPLLIVASPEYLDRSGRPASPDELGAHQFVLYSWMQFGRRATLVGQGGQKAVVDLSARLSVNNVGAIRRAVLAGAGLHIGPHWIFADDLQQRRLEHVLPDWAPVAAPVHALRRPSNFEPAKIRVTLDMLIDRSKGVVGVG